MKVKAKINLIHDGKMYEAGKEYELSPDFVSKFPHVFEEIKKIIKKEQPADLEKELKAKDKEIETLKKRIKELEAEIQKLKKK